MFHNPYKSLILIVFITLAASTVNTQTTNTINQATLEKSLSIEQVRPTVLNINYTLQATESDLSVYVGVVIQKPNYQVRNMFFDTKTVNASTPRLCLFSQVIEPEVKGNWRISVLVFAEDKVTPLSVVTKIYEVN